MLYEVITKRLEDVVSISTLEPLVVDPHHHGQVGPVGRRRAEHHAAGAALEVAVEVLPGARTAGRLDDVV